MKKTNRLTVALASAFLCALFLTGCAPKTPEAVLTRAALKGASDDAKNCRTKSTIEFTMMGNQKTYDCKVEMSADIIAEPKMNAAVKFSSDMAGLGKINMDMYVVDSGDDYYLYRQDKDKWKKKLIKGDEINKELSNAGMVSASDYVNYSKILSALSMTDDTLDGVDMYKVRGKLSVKDATDEVMATLENMGIGADSGFDLSQLKSIDITFWIDKNTFLPAKEVMDMTEMMKQLLSESTKGTRMQGQIAVDDVVMTIEWSDFGKVEKITLPAEAESALLE